MEADSPEIAALLFAYCYACIDLRRAFTTRDRSKLGTAEAQRVSEAREFFGEAKRAYFEAAMDARPLDAPPKQAP